MYPGRHVYPALVLSVAARLSDPTYLSDLGGQSPANPALPSEPINAIGPSGKTGADR